MLTRRPSQIIYRFSSNDAIAALGCLEQVLLPQSRVRILDRVDRMKDKRGLPPTARRTSFWETLNKGGCLLIMGIPLRNLHGFPLEQPLQSQRSA